MLEKYVHVLIHLKNSASSLYLDVNSIFKQMPFHDDFGEEMFAFMKSK